MIVSNKQTLELLKAFWIECEKNNVSCSFNWKHVNVGTSKFFLAQAQQKKKNILVHIKHVLLLP